METTWPAHPNIYLPPQFPSSCTGVLHLPDYTSRKLENMILKEKFGNNSSLLVDGSTIIYYYFVCGWRTMWLQHVKMHLKCGTSLTTLTGFSVPRFTYLPVLYEKVYCYWTWACTDMKLYLTLCVYVELKDCKIKAGRLKTVSSVFISSVAGL